MDGSVVREPIALDNDPAAPSVEVSRQATSLLADLAPGSLVVVRDEEWLVTQVSQTATGRC